MDPIKTNNNPSFEIKNEPDLISELPVEMLQHIFSNLDIGSAAKSTQVSKHWQANVLQEFQSQQNKKIALCHRFIVQKLKTANGDQNLAQVGKKVSALANAFSQSPGKTLKEIDGNYHAAKISLIQELSALDLAHLNEMKNSLDSEMAHLANLALRCKVIQDGSKVDPSKKESWSPRLFAIQEMADQGLLYLAQDFKLTIEEYSWGVNQTQIIAQITKELKEKGDIKGSIHFAHSFPYKERTEFALKEMALARLEKGDVQGCLQLVAATKVVRQRPTIIAEFANQELERGHKKQAAALIAALPPKNQAAFNQSLK